MADVLLGNGFSVEVAPPVSDVTVECPAGTDVAVAVVPVVGPAGPLGPDGPAGPVGPPGPDSAGVVLALSTHIDDLTPHRAYDDGIDLMVLYENAKTPGVM